MQTETNNVQAEQDKRPVLLTEDEKIDMAATQILERFRPAFEELAK